jgi:hypothetical protein
LRALLRPLLARRPWSQPATVVTVTAGKGAALASVRLVVVGSASHCVAGNVK